MCGLLALFLQEDRKLGLIPFYVSYVLFWYKLLYRGSFQALYCISTTHDLAICYDVFVRPFVSSSHVITDRYQNGWVCHYIAREFITVVLLSIGLCLLPTIHSTSITVWGRWCQHRHNVFRGWPESLYISAIFSCEVILQFLLSPFSYFFWLRNLSCFINSVDIWFVIGEFKLDRASITSENLDWSECCFRPIHGCE